MLPTVIPVAEVKEDMKPEELTELHYITHIENMKSIMRFGLLSNRRASRTRHNSVAMQVIQERRAGKRVPGGLLLHDYVNLYLCARNPMMYKLRGRHKELCVLRIDVGVLNIPGTIVTDRNASSDWACFYPSPVGLKHVDLELVCAQSWVHNDEIETFKHKSIKCAEVLVPHHVPTSFFKGVYVSCAESMSRLHCLAGDGKLEIEVYPHMFFL